MTALTRGLRHVDRHLALGLGLLVVLLATGVLDAVTTVAQWRDEEVVARTHQTIDALRDFRSNLVEARAAVRGRVLGSSQDDQRAYVERVEAAHASLDTLDRLTASDPQRQPMVTRLRADLLGLEGLWSTWLKTRDESGSDAAAALVLKQSTGSDLLQKTFAHVDESRQAEQRLLQQRSEALHHAYFVALWSGILSSLMSVGLVGLYISALRARARSMEEAAVRLEALSDALRDADRKKDAFLATLAHELRSPLAPIKNASAILARGGLQEHDGTRLAAMLDRQASQMAALVNDLLDIARITQGKLLLRRQQVLLSQVLDTALEASTPAIEAKNHQLEVVRPALNPPLDVDPVRLAQVITNLLNNAARYTEPGGRVRLQAEVLGRELRVVVSDTGIGIPPDARQKVFEMFEQLEPGARRSQAGLGIGLALARAIVELHGGSISLRSDGRGKGTEFTVVLPQVVQQADLDEVPASERGGSPTASVPGSQPGISVIDTNPGEAPGAA